jgi:hypothetical protein
MGNNKKVLFVVNYGLMYTSTQIIMEWAGITPYKTLNTNFHHVVNSVDSFLHEYSDFEDTIIFIGFSDDIEKEIRRIYRKYTSMKFINNGEDSNAYTKALKMVKGKPLTKYQKLFIKYTHDWVTQTYNTKESYILSILYRKLNCEVFYKYFRNGYGDISIHGKHIKEHYDRFKKQNMSVYGYEGLYFVNSDVSFLDDCMYKYLTKYPNISLIDTNKGRIYLRQHERCELDLKSFSERYLSNVVGYGSVYSGMITKDFLQLTKQMKKI